MVYKRKIKGSLASWWCKTYTYLKKGIQFGFIIVCATTSQTCKSFITILLFVSGKLFKFNVQKNVHFSFKHSLIGFIFTWEHFPLFIINYNIHSMILILPNWDFKIPSETIYQGVVLLHANILTCIQLQNNNQMLLLRIVYNIFWNSLNFFVFTNMVIFLGNVF